MPSFLSINALALAIAAVAAGAIVPFQSASNAALGRELGHPIWATLASLLVSILTVMLIILVMRAPVPSLHKFHSAPVWAWFGGVVGVIFITSALILTPRVGATNFIVCVIAGQMLTSLLIDHFGLMGLPVRDVNFGRVGGVLLIFIGTLLVQWFTVSQEIT